MSGRWWTPCKKSCFPVSDIVIKASHLSKKYRLGVFAAATLRETIHEFAKGALSRRAAAADSELWALRDVSFEIARGELFGIIGRNGAGKSTLLKIISRITHPTTGRLEIEGRVGSLLEVGTGFHPELTGRENVFLNGCILGMRHAEIRRKFDEIVEFSGVERFLDTPVKRYSSGMHTRLAFSVAAHLETDILVVDEVLAVGDAQFRKKCLGKMREVSAAGRTILFVSHNAAAVASLCTRAILIEQGTIAAEGPAPAVLEQYARRDKEADAVSLAERRDRSGNGDARIVDFAVNTRHGERMTRVQLGEPLEFRLRVRFPARALGRRGRVSIHVRDRNEQRLFSTYSHLSGLVLQVTHEEMSFQCDVPEGFPLQPDFYGIDLGVMVDDLLADKVEWAETIEVFAADFYGSGELPPPAGGALLIKYEWKVAAREESAAPGRAA